MLWQNIFLLSFTSWEFTLIDLDHSIEIALRVCRFVYAQRTGEMTHERAAGIHHCKITEFNPFEIA